MWMEAHSKWENDTAPTYATSSIAPFRRLSILSLSLIRASNIQSKIHTYFSFFNPNNLTVLETMNLSHSCELYAPKITHAHRVALAYCSVRYFSIHHTSFFITRIQIHDQHSFTPRYMQCLMVLRERMKLRRFFLIEKA